MKLANYALALLFALALAGLAPAHAQTDPLAPAREGRLQCMTPNVEHRTCVALARFEFTDAGIMNPAETVLVPNPVILIRTETPVIVRGNAVCGVMNAEDMERATFTIEGQAATQEQAQGIRDAVAPYFQPLYGLEVCSAVVTGADGAQRMEASIDGARRDDLDMDFIWVGADEGYTVAP